MIPTRLRSKWFLLVMTFSILGASTVRAQDSNCPKDFRPDCPGAHAFFHTVQAALTKNDRHALATMMKYPFLTTINNRKVYISTRAQFLQHFDQIFDKGVRCVILSANDDNIWGNSHGFSVGLGVIWFDDFIPRGEKADVTATDFWTKGEFKIMTVNNGSKIPCDKLREVP